MKKIGIVIVPIFWLFYKSKLKIFTFCTKFVIILSKNGEIGGKMKKCLVTITTVIDNRATEFTYQGEGEFSPSSAKLHYFEENAQTQLTLSDGIVCISRKGDYTLQLFFEKGKRRKGILGINGADGEVHTETTRIAYSLSETSLLLSMHYALLAGDEPQKTKVRLFAKEIEV